MKCHRSPPEFIARLFVIDRNLYHTLTCYFRKLGIVYKHVSYGFTCTSKNVVYLWKANYRVDFMKVTVLLKICPGEKQQLFLEQRIISFLWTAIILEWMSKPTLFSHHNPVFNCLSFYKFSSWTWRKFHSDQDQFWRAPCLCGREWQFSPQLFVPLKRSLGSYF